MRITILIVTIVASFLLTLLWLAGWLFGLALPIEIAGSVLLVSGSAVYCLIVYLLRLQAASSLERGLLAQGNEQAKAIRPDRRPELMRLQQQVAEGIAALKDTRLGRGGKAALFALPWYLIIGPPGTGKTTAIRHSGLPFPLDRGDAAARRGTGGTRNCDWWFSSEAILLDSAGRYFSEDDDQEEWLAFLDLLKKHRPGKPLNGLIVAVSLEELRGADDDAIAGMARRMRARIDEVTTRLKVIVPVYVLLTKADMVTGFSEFWADLRKSDRGQIWGIGFPVDVEGEPWANFDRDFDDFMQALQARAVVRLQGERDPAMRRRLWVFPLELGTVRPRVTTFLSQLFAHNAYQEPLLLRGVYLTSGTQTAPPMSRVLGEMASVFGIRLPAAQGPAIEPKSFFLTDVFRRVMIADRNLAVRSHGERRRRLLLRLGVTVAALALAAGLDLPALVSFLRNRELIDSTRDVATAVSGAEWSDAASLEKNAPRLDAARTVLEELAGWKSGGPPAQLRWGMYVGGNLYEPLRDAYVAAIDKAMVGPEKRELERKLRAMDPSTQRTTDDFNRDLETLKLYMMLGDPAHMEPAWAARRIVDDRLAAAPKGGRAESFELLLPHITRSFELLASREVAPWKVDASLVARTRSILNQVPRIDRLYEALVRDANSEIAPIRREMVFYGTVGPFVQSRRGVQVTGAYTKQGWARVRALLGEQKAKLAAQQWVLEDAAAGGGDVEAAIGKLRDIYFERYRTAWREFLADLQVVDPGNVDQALDEINALSEPEWPYLRLIRLVADHVRLDMADPDAQPGLLEKAVEKGKEMLDAGAPKKPAEISPVERAFRPLLRFGLPPESASAKDLDSAPPTGLSQYEALLSKVIGGLTDLRDAQAGTDPRKVSDVFQDAFRATNALLSEQDGFTRPLLSPLLMTPINMAWANVVHDAGAAAGQSWESGVWSRWHDKLEGRYPFVATGRDAQLNDVFEFFAPGTGLLWGFYDESLKATLDRRGSDFVPSRRFKSTIDYAPDFLATCLKKGQQFTTALFPPRSDKPGVTFEVNLHSVSPTIGEVSFDIDGAAHTYRNEPEQWISVTWPGTGAHGGRISVKGAGGLQEQVNQPGDFGLFRLLDQADVRPGRAGGRADGSPTLVATWTIRTARDSSVSLDLRPTRNENPLAPGYFRNYQCPRVITTK